MCARNQPTTTCNNAHNKNFSHDKSVGGFLFQHDSATMVFAETSMLEHVIEDIFHMMKLKMHCDEGLNRAVMVNLHENMPVVCWFKLHSWFFLNPREHNNGFACPHFGEVMIQCLETLHEIPQFKVDTDLTLTLKIISVVCEVREILLTMSKNKK